MKTRIAFWHAEGIVKSADYAFGYNPPYAQIADVRQRGRQVRKVPAVTRASIKTKVADVCSDPSGMKLAADRFVNALL